MVFHKIVFLVVIGTAVATLEMGTLECKMNVNYQENICNGCTCLKEGTDMLGCTERLCGSQLGIELRDCTVGTKWIDEKKKQCWCIKSLGTICEVN